MMIDDDDNDGWSPQVLDLQKGNTLHLGTGGFDQTHNFETFTGKAGSITFCVHLISAAP